MVVETDSTADERLLLQLLEVSSAVWTCTSYVGEHEFTEPLDVALRPAKSDELIQVVIILEDLLNHILPTSLHDLGNQEQGK